MRNLRFFSALKRGVNWTSLLLALALPAAPAAGQDGKKASGKEATPNPQASEEVPPDGKAEERIPAFKGAKGEETFRKGRELFESEKYKEALAEMKRSKDQAKTPEDKELVQTWISSCEGGTTLENYRREAQRGELSRLYFYAVDSAEKYRSTPIGPRFAAFTEEIGSRALLVLENFDTPSPRYSEKFGKRFINDPKIVFRGYHCLEWSSLKDGKVAQLKLKDKDKERDTVPDKWTTFQSIAFWVRWERPVELQLLIMSPGKAEGESNVLEYKHSPSRSGRGGWERVQVDLDKFNKHGAGTLANVENFVIQIDPKTTFKFNIDEIVLVRKDKADASQADSKDGQDKKKKQKKQAGAGPAKQTERKK